MKKLLATAMAVSLLGVGVGAHAAPPVAHGRQASSLDKARSANAADPTLFVDEHSHLVYIEEVFPAPVLDEPPLPPTSADPYTLHSRPGAPKAIYLDTNGHDTYETGWNIYDGETGDSNHIISDPWPATPEQIHAVWLQVSEDYAPWNVDVTTQEPPASQIGMRVVISPTNWYGPAGGVARVNSWNTTSPVFVFTSSLGSIKSIAEASSHETGHALGLRHDGFNTDAYYYGHGSWAPIMGVGYYRPTVTWSKGEYAGANNAEDDIAIISARIPVVSASVTGLISTRTDVERFPVTGPVNVTITPASPSWNLDASLKLFALDGTLLAVADPPGTAYATLNVPEGDYTIEIDGVGSADYPDYGSLGRYSITLLDQPPTTTTTTTSTTTTTLPPTTTTTTTTTTVKPTTTTSVPPQTTTTTIKACGNSKRPGCR